MSKQMIRRILLVSLLTTAVSTMWATESLAGGSTSIDNGIVRVTVEWSQGPAPLEGTNFLVTFTNPLNPDIELKTGDLGWIVSSELVSSSNPANVGSLTTPDAENYAVDIAKAQNVGSLTLQPAGDHFSSLNGGINGDLTSQLTLQQDTAEGGSISFLIVGDASGNIAIPSMANGGILQIDGESSGHIGIPAMQNGVLNLNEIS